MRFIKRGILFCVLFAVLLSMLGMTVTASVDEDDILPILTINADGDLPEKLLLGSQVTAPTATATDEIDGNLVPTLRITYNDSEILTQTENRQYTLDKVGEYSFYFETKNSRNLYAFKNYKIQVKKFHIALLLESENLTTSPVGKEILLKTAKVLDFSGNVTTIAPAVAVSLDGMAIELKENAFVPAQAGDYKITYTATKEDEVVTLQNTIAVYGEKPVVSVKNVPTEGVVGEEIVLPQATGRDSKGNVLPVTVIVTKDGQPVEIENMSFTPKSEGDYIVAYATVDNDGIEEKAIFTISVKTAATAGCGCGSVVGEGFPFVGGLILLTCVLSMVLILTRRKTQE